MPSDLIWDIAVDEEQSSYGKCIHAPESMFRQVAGILFKLATEKPDRRLASDLNRDLIEDFDFQARLFAFATQLLSGEICGGTDDMGNLRQKPDNPCVLQQEQAGEWVDVFDYSLCMSGFSENIIDAIGSEQQANQIAGSLPILSDLWKEFEDKYTGTSASFDPQLEITGPDTTLRRDALCAALKETIETFADDSLKAKDEESENLSKAALAISVGAAVVGFILLLASGGTLGPVIGALYTAYYSAGTAAMVSATIGLSTAGLAVWAQAVKDTAKSTFEDGPALQELACLWFTQMEELTDVSQEDFSAPIDTTSAIRANTVTLASAFQGLQQQPIAYAVFLKVWKRNIQFGAAGIDADCSCELVPYANIVNRTPSWVGTTIQYKGENEAGYEVWDFTLPSAGLNGGNAIYCYALFEFKIVSTTLLSGSPDEASNDAIPYILGDNVTFDPDFVLGEFLFYGDGFPLKLRLVIDWQDI